MRRLDCCVFLCCLVWLPTATIRADMDLLSNIVHHMKLVEDRVSANSDPSSIDCPHLLSVFNLSLPAGTLAGLFAQEMRAVAHLVRFLNGFLSHPSGLDTLPSLAARWDTLEPIARTAVGILLDTEARLKAAHLCRLVREDGSSLPETIASPNNVICQYYKKNSLPNSGNAVQTWREKPRNLQTLIKDAVMQLQEVQNDASVQRSTWSEPYLDCNGTWLVTYMVALITPKDHNVRFSDYKVPLTRGVLAIDIAMEEYVDVNQCADPDNPASPFANTNKCKHSTTTCHNISGNGFRKGSYQCHCHPGFYLTGLSPFFRGDDVEEAYARKAAGLSDDYDNQFNCLPCAADCSTCVDGSPCVVTYDIVTRGLPLGALAFCITCAIFVGGSVFRYRRRKVIASATWPLLENIVVGAILIYSSVIVRYFHPTTQLCLAEPWLREMGFVFLYCAVILKLYKVVTEFRTRKAHCVYVRDKDLVKYHVGITLITLGFMAAWTSVTADLHHDGKELVGTYYDRNNLRYRICRLPWWDYVAESTEMLILLWGVYLSYLARNCKTLYMERKLLSSAILVELVVSGILYVIRHVIWYNVHPDVIYILYFLRSQFTVTVNLLIIFGGKMWYIFRPQDDPFRKNQAHGTQGRPAEMEKLHDGIFAGDLELNQIPLADMDHAEIRMELRRLYAQMQILKTKAMRKDNPHISKKKGGRKMPHRRWADAQAERACKMIQRHPKYDEETTAVNRTPEESSASLENYPADLPSVVYEEPRTDVVPASLHTSFSSAQHPHNGLSMAINYGHVTNL